jgi:hypothetical protein
MNTVPAAFERYSWRIGGYLLGLLPIVPTPAAVTRLSVPAVDIVPAVSVIAPLPAAVKVTDEPVIVAPSATAPLLPPLVMLTPLTL